MAEELKVQEDKAYYERVEREKNLRDKIEKTFEQDNKNNLEFTMEHDVLENSSMNVSAFIMDGAQKEKLKQIEIIGDMIKERGKF